MKLPLVLWTLVFEFGNLDDWLNVMYLSRHHFKLLKPQMFKFIKITMKQRLLKYVNDVEDFDSNNFWQLLQKYNGQITGSIHLQLLLGSDQFESHDVDVFIARENNYFFSELHQFLYERSTGYISKPDHVLTDHQRKKAAKFVHTCENPDIITDQPIEVTYSDVNVKMRCFKSSHKICGVYEYKIENVTFQVITMVEYDEKQHSKKCSNIPQFIENSFDIECCKSRFNGDKLVIRNVVDVYQRKLAISQEYQQYVKFFNCFQTERHQNRIQKYVNRRFTLVSKLHYGQFYFSMIQANDKKRKYLEDNKQEQNGVSQKITMDDMLQYFPTRENPYRNCRGEQVVVVSKRKAVVRKNRRSKRLRKLK